MHIPFQVGDPVTGDKFFDRKEILKELIMSISSLKGGTRQDFALISPRRIGKSSLLLTLSNKLDKNLLCIYVDCSKIYPFKIENFLMIYSKKIYFKYAQLFKWEILPRRIEEAIKGFGSAALSIIQKVGAEAELIKVWLEFKENKIKKEELLEKILTLPEELAKKKDIYFVIMLDEFQELTKFGTEFLKYLRGTITAHKKVNYIIAGSNVSLMENLLNKKNSPFYNLFLIKNLGNLPKGEAKLFLEKKFKGFTFTPEALEEIIELTQGHPFYLQWLARAIFIRAIDTKKFNREDVKKAFKEAMNETSGHFKYELSKIESKGKYMDILTVMAKHDAATPSVIGKYLDMEAGSVAPYLKRLIEYGYLEKSNGEYGFRDFILKEWIKIRYEF